MGIAVARRPVAVPGTAGTNREQPRARRRFYAAWQAVKQFDAYFLFQVLYLARKSGLGDAKPLGSATVMLLFADGYEISQMSQFHINTLVLSILYKKCLGRMGHIAAKLAKPSKVL